MFTVFLTVSRKPLTLFGSSLPPMDITIVPNENTNAPAGKLADAELVFTDGALEGLKLIGRYGANAQHTMFYIVEADDVNALQKFLFPGFKRCTATITPPPGSSCIRRPRAATSTHTSASDNTPATCAAANSPIECPATKSGTSPHDSTNRNNATSTANNAG